MNVWAWFGSILLQIVHNKCRETFTRMSSKKQKKKEGKINLLKRSSLLAKKCYILSAAFCPLACEKGTCSFSKLLPSRGLNMEKFWARLQVQGKRCQSSICTYIHACIFMYVGMYLLRYSHTGETFACKHEKFSVFNDGTRNVLVTRQTKMCLMWYWNIFFCFFG